MNSIPSGTGGQTALSPDATERERVYWESQCDRLRTELIEMKTSHDRWKEACIHLEQQSEHQLNELRDAMEFWKREHSILERNLAVRTKELKEGVEFWRHEHSVVESALQQWVEWYAEARRNHDTLKEMNEKMREDLEQLHSKHENLSGIYERITTTRMFRAAEFLRRVFKARP